jgi:hypothetical protein
MRHFVLLFALAGCTTQTTDTNSGVDSDTDIADTDSDETDTDPLDTGEPTLVEHDGDFAIQNDSDLAAARKFSRVTGTLSIEHPLLEDLELPWLEQVYRFSVKDQDQLLSIHLEALTTVDEVVLIEDCARVTQISMPSLAGVAHTMLIQRNAAMTDLSFPSLERVGDLTVHQNDVLTDMKGFSSITQIAPYNQTGTPFDNLSGLSVALNPKMTSLAGLEGLREVTWSIFITNNATLKDISALEDVGPVHGDFGVNQNPELSQCEAEDMVNGVNPEGHILVANNGPC